MKSIINFFKYNNAFPLILFAVLLAVGSALAASTELRQAVFPSQNSTNVSVPAAVKKTDASKLLAENFKNYDLVLRIDSIKEDAENFYVVYSYRTLEIQNGVWQEIRKTGKMEISKKLLGKRDLKTYLADQIGQVIDREIAYLSEAQASIKTPPISKTSSKYAGLVGEEIERGKKNDNNVKKENENEVVPIEENVLPEEEKKMPIENVVSKEEIREMITAAVADFLAVDTSMPDISQTIPQEQESAVSDETILPEETSSDETTPIEGNSVQETPVQETPISSQE